jgi:hypothetical protein
VDHMPEAPRRTCDQLIRNEGTELRSPDSYQEHPCGNDAGAYCTDDAMYLCVIHWNAKHGHHSVARR